jgi:serine phosphatase RsbU (regulator of sigma subunit)
MRHALRKNGNEEKLRTGIVRQLILYTVLFSIVLTAATTAFNVHNEYRRDMHALEQRMELIRASYLDSLSSSLWAMDAAQITLQLQGILQIPDMHYVEIIEQQQITQQAGNPPANVGLIHEFPLRYRHHEREVELGILRVTAGLQALQARLQERIWRLLFSQGIQISLVAWFMFMLFQYLVNRHLHAIALYAAELRTDNLDNILILKRRLRHNRFDELDMLTQAINSMRLYLGDAYREAEQAHTQLQILNQELEQRVLQRTAELAQANHEIIQLNQRLSAENLRMGTELEVSRHLQRMVLPTRLELEEIKDLEIACYMEPASEVGGDYYDILRHASGIKIGIGDVTGHGLESGVLMLMVQTAVRTLLESNIHDPKLFLAALNRSIYANVQRMNLDKNLTLTLLDYHDGKLHLTGQHEEILLVRHNGEIERLDTLDLGFMVGMIPDIDHLLGHIETRLEAGDGIVLYTDGITEAHNRAREMYGLDRLCTVISRSWHDGVDAVQHAVIEDVHHHLDGQEIKDDLTLLVLKRLPTKQSLTCIHLLENSVAALS